MHLVGFTIEIELILFILATFKFVAALCSLQRRRRNAAQRQVRAVCGTFQGSLFTKLYTIHTLSPRLVRGTYSYKEGFSLSVLAGSLNIIMNLLLLLLCHNYTINFNLINTLPFILIYCLHEMPISCSFSL